MTREGCQFPELSPRTGYDKGCRCKGCRDAEAEHARRYREANREKVAERRRRYYEANWEKVAECQRRYREANWEKVAERNRRHYEASPILQKARGRRTRERYATFCPAIVTGRYAPAEDAMIASWEGTWPQLAEVLGRSVTSLTSRIGKLRKKGLIP